MMETRLKQTAVILIIFSFLILCRDILAQSDLYLDEGYRDPFLPWLPQESEEQPTTTNVPMVSQKPIVMPSLAVQGMVWDSARPQAIVNNMVVEVGDKIEGAEVIDINKEGVMILFEGTTHTIKPEIITSKEKTRRR